MSLASTILKDIGTFSEEEIAPQVEAPQETLKAYYQFLNEYKLENSYKPD